MGLVITLDGQSLFIDHNEAVGFFVEVTDLALFLGYTQPGAIKKQILGDWKFRFQKADDFFIQKNIGIIVLWEQRRLNQNYPTLLPLAQRSKDRKTSDDTRMYLTEKGFRRVLQLTSKPLGPKLCLAMAKHSPVFRAPDLPEDLLQEPVLEFPPLEAAQEPPQKEPAVLSLEERKFRFEVIRTLLTQLKELKGSGLFMEMRNQPLLELALEAAETALGQSLPAIRAWCFTPPLHQGTPEVPTPAPPRDPQTPPRAVPLRTRPNLSEPPVIPGL